MAKLNFNKSFFKKKRKQKYPRNKFFTYTNEDRSGKNFNFKDFRNSTSYNSKFNRALFYGTYFNKTTMKFCGFNGAFFILLHLKIVILKVQGLEGLYLKIVILKIVS